MEEKKLKFGILCNGLSFQQWQANAIKGLVEHPSFELSLLIINGNPAEKKSLSKKIFSRTLFFTQYETRFLKIPAKQAVDMQDLLEDVPQITITTLNKGKYSQYFQDDDLAEIKAKELDFIIRFGFGILKGEILTAAKYGVWSYHHGDEQKYRGGPPGFWEIYNGSKTTSVILQQLTPALDGGKVLKKGTFKTIYNSYPVQLDEILRHSSGWIQQVGLQILEGQLEPEKIPPAGAKGKLYKAPGNVTFLIFLLKLWCNKLDFKLKALFRVELWNIARAHTPIKDIINNTPLSLQWFPTKDEKKFHYRADPFVLNTNENTRLFFEKYEYKSGEGHIAGMDYNPATEVFGEETIALKTGFHLSYPSVFCFEGKNYCLPESYKSNNLDLYEINTDYSLQKIATLIHDIQAVDPTLLYHNRKFWLFLGQHKNAPNAQLYVYYADTITGPYHHHLLNPVKTDIGSARPAGSVFEFEGKLIRPAQNCSNTYGGSLVFNHITKLTETEYEENFLTEIKPTDKVYNKGIHHICMARDIVMVDGKRYIYSLKAALKRLLGTQKG